MLKPVFELTTIIVQLDQRDEDEANWCGTINKHSTKDEAERNGTFEMTV